VTDVAKNLLAVAFTDQNGNHTYEPDTDLLIASLTDTNNDEVVSVGDTIHWGTYPTTFDGTGARGTFTISESLVTSVDDADENFVNVETEFGRVEWNILPWAHEFVLLIAGDSLLIRDHTADTVFDDVLSAEDPAIGGVPWNNPVDTRLVQEGDQGFIDVLFFI
jgi:hypothetical protein